MKSRPLSLAISSLIVLYAGVNLTVDSLLTEDLAAERALCRYFVCANDLVAATARAGMATGEEEDLRLALPLLQEVVRRNPHSPFPWLDLAAAHIAAGRQDAARLCVNRGLRQGPADARVLLRAGNAYLQLGDRSAAYENLSAVLALVRDYDPVVFHSYMRMGEPPVEILRRGIPHDPEAARAFLRSLLRDDVATADLQAVGAELQSLGLFRAESARELAEELFARGLRVEAKDVICKALDADRCEPNDGNLVFDSDFGRDWTTGAFGWRRSEGKGFSISRIDSSESMGGKLLRVSFDGSEGSEFQHLRQLIVVDRPGDYRLRARIRLDDLSGDRGVSFLVRDADNRQLWQAQSESLLADSEWRVAELDFRVPPATELLEVLLTRGDATRLSGKIQGLVQLDWVTVTPLRGELTSNARVFPKETTRRRFATSSE